MLQMQSADCYWNQESSNTRVSFAKIVHVSRFSLAVRSDANAIFRMSNDERRSCNTVERSYNSGCVSQHRDYPSPLLSQLERSRPTVQVDIILDNSKHWCQVAVKCFQCSPMLLNSVMWATRTLTLIFNSVS